MRVTDKNGRPVEITVYGRYDDDIQIDEAYYTDADDQEPDDDMLAWIAETFASEIYEQWLDDCAGRAEAYADAREDR